MAIYEEYLYTFLTTHPDLTSIFGTRCYPLKMPQTERRASMTYQMTQRLGDQIFAGQTGREDRTYSVTVWDASYLVAKTNAELLQLVFDQRQQQIGPFPTVCFGRDQRDVYDPDAELFGVETDLQLLFMNYPPA